MASELLTDVKIKKLQPSDKQYEKWDKKVPGFGVRVSPSGTKSFQLLYRVGKRLRRFTLGRYPTLTLFDARKVAQSALGEIAKGKDPAAEKKLKRVDPLHFSNFVEHFIEDYAKRQNKSWAETKRLLDREFISKWGKRNIREIKKHDVTAVLDSIVNRGHPIAANRAYATVRKLFNWAVERGNLEISPCQGLKAPSKFNKRDRVLNDDELNKIWAGANKMAYPFGKIVQLLILTGQRLGEVSAMRWEDIDLENLVWTITAANNKSGTEHKVPLSDIVVTLLRSLPRTHDIYVFPARGKDNPVSGFSKWKKKIDELSGVRGWTLHDIRRTAATGMAKLKVQPYIVERILNHSSGTFSGVAGIYNRHGYLDEMRDALKDWNKYVEGIMT